MSRSMRVAPQANSVGRTSSSWVATGRMRQFGTFATTIPFALMARLIGSSARVRCLEGDFAPYPLRVLCESSPPAKKMGLAERGAASIGSRQAICHLPLGFDVQAILHRRFGGGDLSVGRSTRWRTCRRWRALRGLRRLGGDRLCLRRRNRCDSDAISPRASVYHDEKHHESCSQ